MKSLFYTTVLILTFLLTSCNKENPVSSVPRQNLSKISLNLSMKDAPPNIIRIVGILSRNGYDTLKSNFVIMNNTATCEFDNIAAGTWHLQVDAYDSTNIIQYTGSADVEVLPDETTPVNLVLNPATGTIIINVTWPNNQINLIQNPSFEFNGIPSVDGWIIKDTAQIKVVNEAAPSEGSWSLWFAPSVGPLVIGDFAQTFVTGQSGNLVLTLSFWEMNIASYSWGIVQLSQIRNQKVIYSKFTSSNYAAWTLSSQTDTLSLLPTDTLSVTLLTGTTIVKANGTAGSDSVSSGVLFDGVSIIENR